MIGTQLKLVAPHPPQKAKGWGTDIFLRRSLFRISAGTAGTLGQPALSVVERARPYFFSAAAIAVAPSLLNSVIISSGSGKTMVVFFSTPISVSVCR